MPKFPNCPKTNCDELAKNVINDRKEKQSSKRAVGGVRITRVGKDPRGITLAVDRCYQYDWLSRKTDSDNSERCTASIPITIPQKTLDCYKKTADFLVRERKKMGGKGVGAMGKAFKENVFAFIACSTGRNPASSSIIANLLGAKRNIIIDTTWTLSHEGMKLGTIPEPMKIVCTKQISARDMRGVSKLDRKLMRTRIEHLNEEICLLPDHKKFFRIVPR